MYVTTIYYVDSRTSWIPYLIANRILLILLIATCVLLAPVASFADTTITAHAPAPLKKRNGYLIVDLDLQRDTGAITIGRWRGSPSASKRKLKTVAELGPLREGRHLYLLSLPEGEYAWSEINIPHYDLPHRVDLSQDERWSFSVRAQQLNYSGQLLVNEDRSSDTASVLLLNRIAYSLDDLRTTFPEAFAAYPLRSAGTYRDTFIETFLTSTDDVK